MPIISLDEFRKRYPEIVVSPHFFSMIWHKDEAPKDEEVVIGGHVYRSILAKGLDPEGYRYGLTPVLDFFTYFWGFSYSKELDMTPMEIIEAIYGKYGDDYVWCFNTDNPLAHIKGKDYVSS